MHDPAALRGRLAGVRERIARAAGRAGRDPTSIRLVAISKTFPADAIRAVAEAGQIDFGENKVQEALPKMDAVHDLPIRWHLVGHLQSNKARKAAARFDIVHSVDDLSLVSRLNQAAADARRTLAVLVQVDLVREPTKHGAAVEQVRALLDAVAAAAALELHGLMLMPPAVVDPQQARPYFAALRRLRDALVAEGREASTLRELSMGMSHDFEVAVEEGATLVRVGSAIFGARS